MSRTVRTRPTGAAVVIGAMIGAVALAGCGAGQVAQTASQVSAVGGANGQVGTMAVRNAEIVFEGEGESAAVYPQGGSAPLEASIVNTGAGIDQLIAVTSPAAASVQVNGNAEIPGGQVLLVEGEPQPAPAAPPMATRTAPPGTAAPATPPPSATPTPATEPGGVRQVSIVLTGLREDVQAGLTYPMVFTFARAGEIRLDVPVGSPTSGRERAE